ncbi:MAG: adenylosuccinate lyase family protein [Rhodospirillales bacterium]|jgi:3-carboxy-cis,cis-muconate cycloisomerase|nr:adenylosuccinate lyase family protein [Rhodospirillales bacterium]
MPEPIASETSVSHLFSREALWQSWLDVEAALARIQADLGIIPPEAATEIGKKANFKHIDADELARDIARTKAPVLSLTNMLAAACDGDHGHYVHWGATTQNISQTGRVLQIRKAHALTRQSMANMMTALADLAERGADMPMAGRTLRRQALPITFGFKVAGWIDEMLRHLQRIDEMSPRFFSLQFGGAIGAMQSFGDHGPEISRRLASQLGLSVMRTQLRSTADHLAEYVTTMALYAMTCAKIAQEIYTLMTDEIGEVIEGQDASVVGSSTMPQKVNSKAAVAVIALAARIKGQVGLVLDGMQHSHEGDAAPSRMMGEAMETTCVATYEMTAEMVSLLAGLELKPDRMMENLHRSGGLIVAEHVMMTLAPVIGRHSAHDLVHAAAVRVQQGECDLFAALWADETVRENVPEATLKSALDPANYLGASITTARECAALARAASIPTGTQKP